MTLNELRDAAYNNAKEKGWHDKERSPLEVHMLIVSEVAEATEAVREDAPHAYQKQKNYHEIETAKGDIFSISMSDINEVEKYKWYKMNTGYFARTNDDMLLHRFLMNPNDGDIVDHINLDRSDNRRSNLRIVTKHQNKMNQGPTSGRRYKGIYFHGQNQNWVARITHNYKNIHIGCFNTAEEAALAYDEKAKELFGDYAWLNFAKKPTKDSDFEIVLFGDPRWKNHIKPEGHAVELADALIRALDYFGAKGWDLEEIVKAKMAYNATRSHRHGGKVY